MKNSNKINPFYYLLFMNHTCNSKNFKKYIFHSQFTDDLEECFLHGFLFFYFVRTIIMKIYCIVFYFQKKLNRRMIVPFKDKLNWRLVLI